MQVKSENNKFCGAIRGRHLLTIDKALSGKHIIKIYNSINRTAGAILV
jgi:hypothetical protein